MKRKALLILFVFGLAVMTWAQGWGRGGDRPNHPNQPQRQAAEAVTVSGSLIVAHGMPALRSGDKTYLLGRVTRLAGFVDGLREGAQVTVEGSAVTSRRDDNLKFLNPARLTLDGKSYDMTSPASSFGRNRFSGPKAHQRNHQPMGQRGPRR